jgi:hypothetical protein
MRAYLSGAAGFLVLLGLGTFCLSSGRPISSNELSLVAVVLATVAAIGRRLRRAAASRAQVG